MGYTAVLLLGLAAVARAQQAARVTDAQGNRLSLDTLLALFKSRNQIYSQSIPNLICQERADSEREQLVGGDDRITVSTDATFAVRRPVPGVSEHLQEQRQVEHVHVWPPGAAEDAQGRPPVEITGLFSNALNLLSAARQSCFDFRLPPDAHGPDFKIRFATRPDTKALPACASLLPLRGEATVDAKTLRVIRVKGQLTRYEVFPGVLSTWNWTVSFAPVSLDGEVFWLPSKIHSVNVSEDAMTRWTFDASYSRYRRLVVSSRLLPPSQTVRPPTDNAPAPQPPLAPQP